jgi:hypothetical protein
MTTESTENRRRYQQENPQEIFPCQRDSPLFCPHPLLLLSFFSVLSVFLRASVLNPIHDSVVNLSFRRHACSKA